MFCICSLSLVVVSLALRSHDPFRRRFNPDPDNSEQEIADLGGEILALMAWKDATKDKNLQPINGLTPEQRFFVGFAQWDCANMRDEDLRVRAMADPYSSAQNRINGVVVNMPEFSHAFSCKAGQPMTRPSDKVCKVW